MVHHNVCSDDLPECTGCVPSPAPVQAMPARGALATIRSIEIEHDGNRITLVREHDEGRPWSTWKDAASDARWSQTLRGLFVRVE